MSRNSQMRSISSAGQPWKVESVSVFERCVGYSRSRASLNSAREFRAQLFDHGAGIAHAVEEFLDLFAFDAGQVVADAEVEDHFARGAQQRIAAEGRIAAEHFDQHRAGHVFAQRIGRPAAPATTRCCSRRWSCRCRPADRQPVVHLHRFQLQNSRRRPRSSAEYSEPFACAARRRGRRRCRRLCRENGL